MQLFGVGSHCILCIYMACFRFCLEPIIATYRQKFVLKYTGTVVTKDKTDAYKTEIEKRLSAVESDLQAICISNIGAKAPLVTMNKTVTFSVSGLTVSITVVTSIRVRL